MPPPQRAHGRELSAFCACFKESFGHIARDFKRFGNGAALSHQARDRITRGQVAALRQQLHVQADDLLCQAHRR